MLDEIAFSNEVTFTKGAGGISTADGQFVSDVAATRGLGRISGGRMYGYQVGTPPLTSRFCSDACCTTQCMLWQAKGWQLPVTHHAAPPGAGQPLSHRAFHEQRMH